MPFGINLDHHLPHLFGRLGRNKVTYNIMNHVSVYYRFHLLLGYFCILNHHTMCLKS